MSNEETADTGSEVTELIAALNAGRMTIDEVAARFRERTWPHRPPRPEPGTKEYADWYWAVRDMADLNPPGHFDEIDEAYDRRKLTREQRDVLRAAALKSILKEG